MKNYSELNVLVTGADGFIGKNLKSSLKENNIIHTLGEIIFTLDNWEEYVWDFLYERRPEVVFHVGACSNTLEQRVNYMMTVNFEFTKVLTDWCKGTNTPLIYSSSAASYGIDGRYPSNLYGWSKYAAECYVVANGGIALRYFNVYGPGEEFKGNMASVAYQAYKTNKQNGIVKLFPGNPARDFVYVDDVINANIFAWENYGEIKGEKYDVGSGKAEAFEYIMELLDIPFSYYDESVIPKGYQKYTCSDESKWMPTWQPKFSLKQGIEKYKLYLDENLSSKSSS